MLVLCQRQPADFPSQEGQLAKNAAFDNSRIRMVDL
jgi:hypothetical protein